MKKLLLRALLFVSAASFIAGCSSDEDQPLVIDYESFMAVKGTTSYLPIRQGNGDYDVTSDNMSIVLAGYTRTDKSPGQLVLTGMNPGRTKVTVTDKLTGESAAVTIYVTEPYMAAGCSDVAVDIATENDEPEPDGIKEELLKNYPFGTNYTLFFMKETGRLFVELNAGKENPELFQGRYETAGTNAEPVVKITVLEDIDPLEITYALAERGGQILWQFLTGDELQSAGTRMSVAPTSWEISFTEDLTVKVPGDGPGEYSATRTVRGAAEVNKGINPSLADKFL